MTNDLSVRFNRTGGGLSNSLFQARGKSGSLTTLKFKMKFWQCPGIVNPTPLSIPLSCCDKPSYAFLIQAYSSTVYRSFVSFWPLNLAWLAGSPSVYVGWQGQGICDVLSAVAVQLTRF
jgi:hypothetical protein